MRLGRLGGHGTDPASLRLVTEAYRGALRTGTATRKGLCHMKLAVRSGATLVVALATMGLTGSPGAATTPPSADTTVPAGTTPSTGSAASTAPAPSGTAAPASSPAEGSSATTGDATDAGGWEAVTPEDCECSDGSPWTFYLREADPEKVVFILEGGGACWSAETCVPGVGPYDPDVGDDEDPAGLGGIVDVDHADNPFADWSMVYVPYCTGDVHIGNATREYGDVTIEHRGALNGATALAEMVERFPDASSVLVTGASAGSIATPLYAGMVHDRYPDASIVAFGDGSGGYPADAGAINEQLVNTWGFAPSIAAWPEAGTYGPGDWNFSEFWIAAAAHDPELELARFDFAEDAVQLQFIALAGMEAPPALITAQDANEELIEASGVNMESYVTAGDEHTVILGDDFYTATADGPSVAEWIATVLEQDEPVDDIRPAG